MRLGRLNRMTTDQTPSSLLPKKFITGQNERQETTQDTIVTKRAAFASYEINYFATPRRRPSTQADPNGPLQSESESEWQNLRGAPDAREPYAIL
jgi:hypothetical protein